MIREFVVCLLLLSSVRSSVTVDSSIFYFGITHHTSYKKALVAQRTWGKRVCPPSGIVWYIDRHILDDSKAESTLHAHVISHYGRDVYNNITHRSLLIWEHMWKTYPSYRWYARVWDDNYIIKENFEEIIFNKSYNAMVEYGRVGHFESVPFIDGGASSIISVAAVKEFVDRIDECRQIIEAQIHSGSRPWRDCAYYCEDTFISLCRARFGTEFHNIPGLFHFSISRKSIMKVYPIDVACHNTKKIEKGMNETKIRSLHYVSMTEMQKIDNLWYGHNCHLYQSSWFLG